MRTHLLLGLAASLALAVVMAPTASAATKCGQLKGKVVVDKGPIKIVKKAMRRDGFRGYVLRERKHVQLDERGPGPQRGALTP